MGSVHHVSDVPFDDSPESYRLAVDRAGGIEAFYCAYFDRQLELIEAFRPVVVGHFDLARILDIPTTANAGRFRRSENALIGTSSGSPSWILCSTSMPGHLVKGQPEPYVSEPWLKRASVLGVALVPGDDSHGVATVGACIDRGVETLRAAGAPTNWRRPVRMKLDVDEALPRH